MVNHPVWDYITSINQNEKKRLRNCIGCKYLGTAGHNGCCDYYLVTGFRRPTKSSEPCTVKKLIPGFVIPDDYADYCKRCDELERKKQEQEQREKRGRGRPKNKSTNAASQPDSQEVSTEPPVPLYNKRGRPLKWDPEYGLMLYKQGYYLFEIAEICRITKYCLHDYYMTHGWTQQRVKPLHRYRHDIAEEQKLYEDFRKQKLWTGISAEDFARKRGIILD